LRKNDKVKEYYPGVVLTDIGSDEFVLSYKNHQLLQIKNSFNNVVLDALLTGILLGRGLEISK
jgi:hypothetical protein